MGLKSPLNFALFCAVFALSACGGGGGSGSAPGPVIPSGPPPPASYPTGAASSFQKTLVLSAGAVNGAPDTFIPNIGNTSSGGSGSPVDGVPCLPSMVENEYHIHAFVGVILNGVYVSLPAAVGFENPQSPQNGFYFTGSCFYEIHTHDSSGVVHFEFASTASLNSSLYNLGNVFAIWGEALSPSQLGPYAGTVRSFVAKEAANPSQLTPANYTEFVGDPKQIPIYSHEVIWLEASNNGTYILPPQLPAVQFYMDY